MLTLEARHSPVYFLENNAVNGAFSANLSTDGENKSFANTRRNSPAST